MPSMPVVQFIHFFPQSCIAMQAFTWLPSLHSRPQDKVLVPPCIRTHKPTGGTEVRLEIEDRVHRPALVKITADHVRIHITSNIAAETTQPVSCTGLGLCNLTGPFVRRSRSPGLSTHKCWADLFGCLQEILQMMGKALGARLTNLQVCAAFN